jgi:hypothetical protein
MATRAHIVKTQGLSRGEFRLLFTFEERMAQQVLEDTIKAKPIAERTPEENMYLTMRADFSDAEEINLDDPAVDAAMQFFILMGLITEGRASRVMAGLRP